MNGAGDAESGAGAAPDADFFIHLTEGRGKNAFLYDVYGIPRAVHEAIPAACADGTIDMRPNRFFLFAFCDGAVSFGIYDGAAGACVKADAAFLTEEGIYVETPLDFTGDGFFGALFRACATSNTIFADTVRHG